MKIKVLIKDPEKKPRSVWISNTLENLQKTVGGYIEAVTLASDLVIICNEEGRLKGLPYNCNICGVDFVGTIILCGIEGETFAGIPCDYAAAKMMFKSLWGKKKPHYNQRKRQILRLKGELFALK